MILYITTEPMYLTIIFLEVVYNLLVTVILYIVSLHYYIERNSNLYLSLLISKIQNLEAIYVDIGVVCLIDCNSPERFLTFRYQVLFLGLEGDLVFF